jgi:hypothetical protein
MLLGPACSAEEKFGFVPLIPQISSPGKSKGNHRTGKILRKVREKDNLPA